jgi:hypothetical protein
MAQVADKQRDTASSTPPVARVTVNLPARVWNDLARLADRKQISKTDALRQAIATSVCIEEAREEGAHVIIERPDGTRERMLFAY